MLTKTPNSQLAPESGSYSLKLITLDARPLEYLRRWCNYWLHSERLSWVFATRTRRKILLTVWSTTGLNSICLFTLLPRAFPKSFTYEASFHWLRIKELFCLQWTSLLCYFDPVSICCCCDLPCMLPLLSLLLLLHNIDVPISGWHYLCLLRSQWLFWIVGARWGMLLLSCQCWPVAILSCHSCLMLLLLHVFWWSLQNPLLSPHTILHILGWLVPSRSVPLLSEWVQSRRSSRFLQHLLRRFYPVF